MATLAFEDMQNLVDPFDGEAGIARLAVSDRRWETRALPKMPIIGPPERSMRTP
jgi:hypothetical protein